MNLRSSSARPTFSGSNKAKKTQPLPYSPTLFPYHIQLLSPRLLLKRSGQTPKVLDKQWLLFFILLLRNLLTNIFCQKIMYFYIVRYRILSHSAMRAFLGMWTIFFCTKNFSWYDIDACHQLFLRKIDSYFFLEQFFEL